MKLLLPFEGRKGAEDEEGNRGVYVSVPPSVPADKAGFQPTHGGEWK